MRSTRYSTTRQKACHQCAAAKAKCDRKQGTCTRCEQRSLSCTYAQLQLSSPQPELNSSARTSDPGPRDRARSHFPSPEREALNGPVNPEAGLEAAPDAAASHLLPEPAKTAPDRTGVGLDFSNLDLLCPINPDDIANRWLNNFVPLPDQAVKNYPPNISAFIHRILQSYADRSIRGQRLAPFIHWSQLTLASSLPLSTCLSVIRMCERPLRGSEDVVAEVLQREMAKLYERQSTFDDMALLSAYQAYLVYAMVIFFRLGREYYPFLRQAMVNSQELAGETSRRGLMCDAEQKGARPSWEAWIVAETKRRTIFTMCMFDSALLTHDGLASHLATELRGLFAPGSKSLWEATDRRGWETKYNTHLAAWGDGGLRIEELWPIPEGFGETEVEERRARVDLWLEDLDEYGTMMYAVTSCTHGG